MIVCKFLQWIIFVIDSMQISSSHHPIINMWKFQQVTATWPAWAAFFARIELRMRAQLSTITRVCTEVVLRKGSATFWASSHAQLFFSVYLKYYFKCWWWPCAWKATVKPLALWLHVDEPFARWWCSALLKAGWKSGWCDGSLCIPYTYNFFQPAH